jgi:hypothetical protein
MGDRLGTLAADGHLVHSVALKRADSFLPQFIPSTVPIWPDDPLNTLRTPGIFLNITLNTYRPITVDARSRE